MKRSIKVVEPTQRPEAYRGAYQEIAIYVRDLLQCDYALVAVTEKESIRIHGFAGEYGEAYGNLTADLMPQLRNWAPAVVDDARLVAAPVSTDGQILGVLIGYSSKPGRFTADDLDKLMAYSHVAASIFSNGAAVGKVETKTTFTTEELFHFSRLITMGQLAACFAHEVSNPLTLIRGHLRFIDESLSADSPLRTNVDVIDRSSRRIEEMARRMLNFSKKKTHRKQRCNVAELVDEALHFVQPYFRTVFIDVQTQVEPHLSLTLADRWQIVQAVVNLLQNAADAMTDVSRRVLSITGGVEDSQLRVVISDTGTGIAPVILSRIFEPFFTTKGERGTGLGLYIAKQVIEDHCGTIEVQSSNSGTSFVVSLPL
jgi:signal transduction histidine kinase